MLPFSNLALVIRESHLLEDRHADPPRGSASSILFTLIPIAVIVAWATLLMSR